MNAKKVCLAVALCAGVVYLGTLWNQWAMDDLPIIAQNPLVHSLAGVWRAFLTPYWPPGVGGGLYRPLPVATYALDWRLHSVVWFHVVNLLWHMGTSVAVAVLGRRLANDVGGLVAGLLFAVHPVHVEAVANVVGRAELFAACFAVLAVYGALVRDSLTWTLLAWAAALLSKESGVVVPLLVGWGWLTGVGRPVSIRRVGAYAGGFALVALAYGLLRHTALASYGATVSLAPQFIGATPFQIRLTAVATFADFARLLVFPGTLRVDYSPNERVLAASAADPLVWLGVACFLAWGALMWLAWRKGWRVEAFGLGWVGLALLPVANLLFPVGILVAERTLYLPSAGLALAAGSALARLRRPRLQLAVAALVVAGGVRSALRVPVWHNSASVVLSEVDDSPRSFDGYWRMIGMYEAIRQPEKALQVYRVADSLYQQQPWVYLSGADAAFMLNRSALADSILGHLRPLCTDCSVYFRVEADIARNRGDLHVADSLLARSGRSGHP